MRYDLSFWLRLLGVVFFFFLAYGGEEERHEFVKRRYRRTHVCTHRTDGDGRFCIDILGIDSRFGN